jgi:hypothetical protein
MPDKTFTDAAYEFMEGLESRKRWMAVVIVTCFVLGPAGLGFDWIVFDHSKGGLADLASNPLIVITAIASIVIITYGLNRYFLVKKWENRLEQLEQLEETIYKEVLSSSKEFS